MTAQTVTDAINARLEQLVLMRQELHEAGADHRILEANRLEIARLERELSLALIELHKPRGESRIAA